MRHSAILVFVLSTAAYAGKLGNISTAPIGNIAPAPPELFFAAPLGNNAVMFIDSSSQGTSLATLPLNGSAGPMITIAGAMGDFCNRFSKPIVVNGLIYCSLSRSGTLMATDGTLAGTRLIGSPLNVGTPVQLGATSTVLFSAFTPATGYELYAWNGSVATLVGDLRPGSMGSYPEGLTPIGNRVFFVADNDGTGKRLWVTDGTAPLLVSGGPSTVKSYGGLTEVALGSRFLFNGDDGTGNRIWASDGTLAGTRSLGGTISNNEIGVLGVAGGKAFFATAAGFQVTDGTLAGTRSLDGVIAWGRALAIGNTLYFAGSPVGSSNWELWKSDGTDAGTQLVKEIDPGPQASNPYSFFAADGGFVFIASDGLVSGPKLWFSDGTGPGTQPIFYLPYGINGYQYARMAAFGGRVFFVGEPDGGLAIYTTTGGTPTALVVLDGGHYGSDPHDFVALADTTVFTAADGVNGYELWNYRADAGLALVRDINPGPADSVPGFKAARLGNRLFFPATTVNEGTELWETDGTSSGTRLFADLALGASSSSPRDLIPFAGLLYFSAYPGRVWHTDGGSAGTVPQLLYDAGVGWQLTAATSTHVFTLDSQSLYATSGPMSPLGPVPGSPAIARRGQAIGDTLYFSGYTANAGSELWKSDGLSAQLVKDIRPGIEGSDPDFMVALGNRLVFSGLDDPGGRELWISDSTGNGTALLKDINPGPASSNPQVMTVAGPNVFFFAFDPVNGRELWKSDGTPSGTLLVKDITPGPLSGVRDGYGQVQLVAVGTSVYFTATDAVHGFELWKSDGTLTGTVMVEDAVLGPQGLAPYNLALGACGLFYTGIDPDNDDQPWGLQFNDTTPPVVSEVVMAMGGQTNGWYHAEVSVAFAVSDPETSPSNGAGGCDPTLVTADTVLSSFTCTATSCGGTTSLTIGVKLDSTPPTVTCPAPFAVEATSSAGALVVIDAGISDALSGPAPGGLIGQPPGPLPLGTTRVTMSGTDLAGNPGSCGVDVTVRDTQPPTFTCPASFTITIGADETGVAMPNLDVLPMDIVDPMPSVSIAPPPGTTLNLGPQAVTVTVKDGTNNIGAPCSLVVTVQKTGEGLALRPEQKRVAPGESLSFMATGGKPPYVFSLTQNNSDATLDRDLGAYVAGQAEGVDTVQVTDALGASSSTTVSVIAPTTTPTPPSPRERAPGNGWALSGCGCSSSEGSSPGLLVLALLALVASRGRQSVAVALLTAAVVAQVGSAAPPATQGVLIVPADDNARAVVDGLVDQLGKAGLTSRTAGARAPAAACVSEKDEAAQRSCLLRVAATGGAVRGVLLVHAAGSQKRLEVTFEVLELASMASVFKNTITGPAASFEKASTPGVKKVFGALAGLKAFEQAKAPPVDVPTVVAIPPPVKPAVKKEKPTMAVLDVDVTVPNEKLDASAFSELLVSTVDQTQQFRVISSKDIVTMLGLERQKALMGCSDTAGCMTEFANALGSDYVMVASVGRVGDSYLVSVKIMDGPKSKVVSRSTAQSKTANRLLEALWKVTQEALDGYGASLPSGESAQWAARPRKEPPAAMVEDEGGIASSFGVTASGLGSYQPLSVKGMRASVGAEVALTWRSGRLDLGAGVVIGPTPGARLSLAWAVIASTARLGIGLRGTAIPGAQMYGGGPAVTFEYSFTRIFAATATGAVEFYPTAVKGDELILALLATAGLAAHF